MTSNIYGSMDLYHLDDRLVCPKDFFTHSLLWPSSLIDFSWDTCPLTAIQWFNLNQGQYELLSILEMY